MPNLESPKIGRWHWASDHVARIADRGRCVFLQCWVILVKKGFRVFAVHIESVPAEAIAEAPAPQGSQLFPFEVLVEFAGAEAAKTSFFYVS